VIRNQGRATHPGVVATLFALVLLQAGLVSAATFRVSPVRLSLTASSTSGLLTLSNDSSETLRFQLTAFGWGEGSGGEMELAPTEEIILFPRLLTLEAGKERKIRVGAAAPFAAIEKTYRVFVEEIPSADSRDASGSGVRVLTRMGIPIFLRPSKLRAGGAIEQPSVADGRLRFAIRNGGNVHLVLQAVGLRGIGAAGETVLDQQLEGWYVLAGGVRQYDLPLPREQCGRVRSLRIEARTETGTLSDLLDVRPGACRSPGG
jgi:fimbrial chaperone protein